MVMTVREMEASKVRVSRAMQVEVVFFEGKKICKPMLDTVHTQSPSTLTSPRRGFVVL